MRSFNVAEFSNELSKVHQTLLDGLNLCFSEPLFEEIKMVLERQPMSKTVGCLLPERGAERYGAWGNA